MKITKRHRIKDLKRYERVIALDGDFINKVKKFPIPDKIKGVPIKSSGEIELQYIMLSWGIKEEDDLFTITAKAYGLNEKEIGKYPMIDFLRLTIELSETAKKSAEMFKSLRRAAKGDEMKEVTSKLNAGDRDVFVEIMKLSKGAYTQTQVAELPWLLAYDILKVATIEYDKQLAAAEEQKKQMKNGTKRIR